MIRKLSRENSSFEIHDIICLIFSFKESVYKCYQRYTSCNLSFHHAIISKIDLKKKKIFGELRSGDKVVPLTGSFLNCTIDGTSYMITMTSKEKTT